MTPAQEKTTGLRDWRQILQQTRPPAVSREGRRRLALSVAKTGGTIVLLALSLLGVLELSRYYGSRPKAVAPSGIVKEVVLATDGVLSHEWLVATLAIPAGTPLVGLDLRQLQARLEGDGQVQSAVVTRKLPSTLKVLLAERTPIARVRTENDGDMMVAPDGILYAGKGYHPDLVASLPWIGGVTPVRSAAGRVSIPHMAVVSDLLNKARNETPWLFRTWNVVDLSRLDSDGEIEVRSSEISRIVFGTDSDFFIQLAHLDAARDRTRQPISTINLALGPNVVMTLAKPIFPP